MTSQRRRHWASRDNDLHEAVARHERDRHLRVKALEHDFSQDRPQSDGRKNTKDQSSSLDPCERRQGKRRGPPRHTHVDTTAGCAWGALEKVEKTAPSGRHQPKKHHSARLGKSPLPTRCSEAEKERLRPNAPASSNYRGHLHFIRKTNRPIYRRCRGPTGPGDTVPRRAAPQRGTRPATPQDAGDGRSSAP